MKEEIRALKHYKEKNKLSFDSLSKQLNVHIGTVVRWLCRGVNPSPVMSRLIRAFLKEKEGG